MPSPSSEQQQTSDLLAVVSQSGATVTFFETDGYRPVDVLELPAEPHELCLDRARGLLYCSITYKSGFYDDNTGPQHEVAVIDVATRSVVDVIDLSPENAPHALVIDSERDLLYVSVEANADAPGGAVLIELAGRTVVGRIATMAPGPHWFVITPDGRRGYATNKEAEFVSAVDLESRELIGKIAVPGSEGACFSLDGRTLYVAAPKVDFAKIGVVPPEHWAALSSPSSEVEPSEVERGVWVIDVATNAVRDVIPTWGSPMPVHTTVDGRLLVGEYRAKGAPGDGGGSQLAGALTIFDPEHGNAPLGQVEVGAAPLNIISNPDGTVAYCSSVVSSTVTIVALEGPEVITNLEIERDSGSSGAHGLAYLAATS